MKWVTREYVHVDRTACPWLIKRFVDSNAEFIFVSPDKIGEVVEKESAIPYDTPNAELGHHGERCSFDAIVEKYGIDDLAVLEVAKIVRAADTNTMATVPEAAGLEATMNGISMAAKNDNEAVEKAGIVYDALYANCKVKIIRIEHKAEIEKLDKIEQRQFLKKKLME